MSSPVDLTKVRMQAHITTGCWAKAFNHVTLESQMLSLKSFERRAFWDFGRGCSKCTEGISCQHGWIDVLRRSGKASHHWQADLRRQSLFSNIGLRRVGAVCDNLELSSGCNQNKDDEPKRRSRSSYDWLVKTVRHEGVTALWKGFLPTWARLGPWQFVFWVSYEKLRQASGISSFW